MNPIVHTLLMCDVLYTCPATGKVSVLGAWTEMNVHRFPHVQGMRFFMQLSEIKRGFTGILRIMHLDSQTIVAENPFGVPLLNNPLVMVNVNAEALVGLIAPGTYEVQVLCGKDILKTVKFIVRPVAHTPALENQPDEK